MADNERETLAERWLRSLKNRPTIAVFLLLGGVITGIATFTESIDKIVKFFVTYIDAPPIPAPEPWRGWLQPANDPTPANGCDRAHVIPGFSIPPDAPVMVAGGMGVRLTRPGRSRVIQIGRCDSLVFDLGPDGIRVNAPLFDAAGKPLGEIINNGYTVNKEPNLVVEHSGDLSTLVVHDNGGREILYVHYANSRAIQVRGNFNCPSTRNTTVTITNTEIRSGRNMTMGGGGCLTNSGGLCIDCVQSN